MTNDIDKSVILLNLEHSITCSWFDDCIRDVRSHIKSAKKMLEELNLMETKIDLIQQIRDKSKKEWSDANDIK